jgi:hypothetical protein
MSKVSNIFFYYCTIVALFITVSGFLASKALEGHAFQLIFLPITLYFVFAVMRNLAAWVRKSKTGPTLDVTLSGKKAVIVAFFIIFLTLLTIAIKNIFLSKGSKIEHNTPPLVTENSQSLDKEHVLVFKAETSNEAPLQTLTVTADSPTSFVNIRQEPSISSTIIGRASNAQEFSYIQLSGEWYEIVLENGQKGYIHKGYVKEEEK